MKTEAQNQQKVNELVLKLAEAVMRMSGGDALPYEWYSDIQCRFEELKPGYNAAQAVPANLAEKGKQVQAQEEWNKYPKGKAIDAPSEQPKKEGEK